MQIVCVLKELADELGKDLSDVAREVGLERRQLQKLADPQYNWRLPRGIFERLTRFAFENGYPHGIFEIRPHPLWATFREDSPITIFRGSRTWDSDVEALLRRFFESLNRWPETRISAGGDVGAQVAEIREMMATGNCIFVGSPKANPASEIALASIWNATPFDASPKNQEKVPIHVLGMTPEAYTNSAILKSSPRFGFHLQVPTRKGRGFLRVDWKPPEAYREWAGKGQDAAAVVVAKDPLASGRPITTVVIAGFTGRATKVAARELTHGEPPVSSEALASRQPVVTAFAYHFRKLQHKGSPRLGDLRTEIAGTGRWAPPWEEVLEP